MVPFGLAQAPSYFQQLINQVLQGLDFTIAYLDDIVIFSNNEVEYLQHLETVFKRLQDADLNSKNQNVISSGHRYTTWVTCCQLKESNPYLRS